MRHSAAVTDVRDDVIIKPRSLCCAAVRCLSHVYLLLVHSSAGSGVRPVRRSADKQSSVFEMGKSRSGGGHGGVTAGSPGGHRLRGVREEPDSISVQNPEKRTLRR